jgi:hypothetical protein
MPSFSSSATSDGTPRIVDVTGATVTVDRYGMALSRVSTRTGLFLSGGANWYRRISPRAILSAMQPRTPKEPPRHALQAAGNNPPDHALPGTEWIIAGDVHAERPAPMPNGCVSSGRPRGPLPATAFYRERSGWFPCVESNPQFSPQSTNAGRRCPEIRLCEVWPGGRIGNE